MKSDGPVKVSPGASSIGLWIAVAGIVLVGLLVYSNNYQGEFIFDDFPAIVDNPEVHSFYKLGSLLRPAPNTPLSARPVAAISFALNYARGGLDVWGYHLVNNLIHILAALALFGLVRTTLLLPRFAMIYGARANGYGLAVALIWLVHPLNSETVNYLVSRTELLVGLFYFATMFFAASAFRLERPRGWMAAAVVFCALGMASKEVMVSAPVMVLLYDRLFVTGSFTEVFRRRRVFYGALAATWLVVGFYQLDNPRADSVLFDSTSLSILDYFRTQLTVLIHYLQLSFWPQPLVLDSQDWPIVRGFSSELILPMIILCTMAAATLEGIRRGTWWSILGASFFCILAPTSSFIPIVTEIVSERRMYLPLAAVVVLVVFTVDFVWRFLAARYFLERKAIRIAPVLGLIGLVILFGAMTFERNRDYRTAATIWADTVSKRPGNSRAYENLGKALVREGKIEEAVVPIRDAIRLYPKEGPGPELSELYSTLGAILSQLGQFLEAVEMHKKSLELLPEDAIGHYQLGNTYLRVNDMENAELFFRKAIALDKNFPPAHGNLGLLLMQKGEYTEAEEHIKKLLLLAPQDPSAYAIFANLQAQQGRIAEAVALYRQALRLDPGARDIELQLNSLLAAHPETTGLKRKQL
jgi:tetratricopeptide (TPR) repeat protein